jgi:RHS repeat-associated protein
VAVFGLDCGPHRMGCVRTWQWRSARGATKELTLPRIPARLAALVAAILVSAGLSMVPAMPVSARPDPGPGTGDVGWRALLAARGPDPVAPPVKAPVSAPRELSRPGPGAAAVNLPSPGVSEMSLAGDARRAGASPVMLAAGSAAAMGRGLRVEVLDQGITARAGVRGFAFQVSWVPGDSLGTAALPVRVSIDYSGFAELFGGGYANRLRLVALPACALEARVPDGCAVGGTVVPSRNLRSQSRLAAEIGDLAALGQGAVVLAVTAGPEGDEGTFKATPLAVSGDWQVGVGSGEFSWNYEFAVPEAPAGPTPKVSLRYSSGAVDGMVTSRNTQAGQAGLGWSDFADSFIERRYHSCRDDGQVYADLCWKSDNATISLNGISGELVYVPGSANPKQWSVKANPRWRIEQLTGAGNGDDDGEHWRVTTPDGTRYLFGLGVHPDAGIATDSTWTVPVFGDDTGEPCHADTPLPSCVQAWRWNLDRVEDPDGNAWSFFYDKEINHYAALNGWPGLTATPYVRSGTLAEIRYGKRVGDPELFTTQIIYTTGWRCNTLDVPSPCPAPGTAGVTFPDVPTDLLCEANCTVTTPTFFSARRYTAVTTYVWQGNDRFAQDSFRLTHAYQDPDPATTADAKLWLTGIQRSGEAFQPPLAMPPTTFGSVSLANRVDTAGGAVSAMPHWRVGTVTDEFGRGVDVTYARPHPCPDPIPDPPNWDLNTRDCFPQRWAPEGGTSGFAIFHKYVVTRVEVRDTTAGSPPMVTDFSYGDQVQAGLPNTAWHHDRDEFVPLANQTWSEWRGYADVQVAQGSTRSRYRLFRGMQGDRLSGDPFPGPGSRTATVSSLDGTVVNAPDSNWLSGRTLDEVSLRGDGTVERGTLHGYLALVSADAPGPDPLDDARWVGENDTVERRRTPTGGYARRRMQTVYNGILSFPEQVIEHGWLDRSGDERCTRTTYAVNLTAFLLDYSATETRYAGTSCSGTEVTRTETGYDGGAVGAAPTRGNPTTSRVKIDATTWATTTTTYDAMGRPLVVTDPNGHRTTTAYATPTGYPTWITVTNHVGHVRRTDFAGGTTIGRRVPAAETDANGGRITYTYDQLGRLTSVTRPTEQGGAAASWEFHYAIDPNRATPPVVRSRQLQDTRGAGGTPRFLDSWTVFDSLLRERQTHTLSPVAGKVIVADTVYDDRGLVHFTNLPQAVTGTPGAGILPAPQQGWANRTQTEHDHLSRPVWEIFWQGSNAERSTVTGYTHDSTEVTPPAGGRTLTVTDAYDRPVRVEEHDGTAYRPTVYGYDAADRLTSITDPASNRIGYTYDLAGRRLSMDDPDAGDWTYGYDLAGNQTRSTDAAGTSTHTVFDALNREIERHRDAPTGALLASHSYDAPGELGLLDRSTRVSPTGNWIVDVTGYDGRSRPTGRTWTVPAGITGLSGSYPVSYGYDAADHQTSTTYPAAGGLPAETVTTTFNTVGLPETMTGAASYVDVAAYDDRARPLLFGFGANSMGKAWEYDANQLLSRMFAAAGNNTVQDLRIGYDKMQNVTERHTVLSGQTWRECFGYDQRQRLTAAFTTTGTCATGAKGTGAQPYNHTYTYTVDGNLKTRIEGSATTTYGYPASGPTSTRPHAPTAVGSNTYAWNNNGNLISRIAGGQTETLTWDAEHHLAGIDDPDGDSDFVYDADGTRLLRRGPGGATLYLDGHEITAPTSGPVTAVRGYPFGDMAIATRNPTGVDYLVADNQNSVQLSVPAGTSTATVRTYLPYGQARHTGQHDTDHGWIGQIEDDATGLDYLNARYYDPTIGVFLGPDPEYDENRPKTVNPYAYATNNPTSTSDPTGLDPPCFHEVHSSCTPEQKAKQIAPLVPSKTYDEVLSQVTGNPVVRDRSHDLHLEPADNLTDSEFEESIDTAATAEDLAGALQVCDGLGKCARVARFLDIGPVGWVGVVIDCTDGLGPCVRSAALNGVESIPLVGDVIVLIEFANDIGLLQHYIDILNQILSGHVENFGDELTYDREVVEEHGGAVTQTGNANGRLDATGNPIGINQTGQGGMGCPLHNPRGVEPLPGC